MLNCQHINKLLLTVFFAVLALCGTAQSALAELKRVAENYRTLSGFSVKFSVLFYDSPQSPKPARKTDGFLESGQGCSRSVYDGRETVVGRDFIMMMDHPNKTIYYSPKDKKMASSSFELPDSVFFAAYKVTKKAKDESFVSYTLVPKNTDSEFSSVYIKLNHVENTLKEITYHYRGNVKYKKVSVIYSAVTITDNPDKNVFLESTYFIGKKKNAVLKSAYASYKLINSYAYDPKKIYIEQ